MRTIGQLATELGVATHVLRFWEERIPALSPLKLSGGRRYYRAGDAALARAILQLTRTRGVTLAGVAKMIGERGAGAIAAEHGGGAVIARPDRAAVRDRLAGAIDDYRATRR